MNPDSKAAPTRRVLPSRFWRSRIGCLRMDRHRRAVGSSENCAYSPMLAALRPTFGSEQTDLRRA
jgi:hypothetical protein